MDSSEAVKDRQVAIKLAAIDGGDEPEVVWLRLTTNTITAVEDRFGSDEAFDVAYQQRPIATVRTVFALALDMTEQELGERMIDTETPGYVAALDTAWQLGQGVDEELARKVYDARIGFAEGRRRDLRDGFDNALKEIQRQRQKEERERKRGSNGAKLVAPQASQA